MQADHPTLHARRSLTDHIRVRQQRDSGSVPNGEVHHAELQNGSRTEGPASTTTAQPASAPAAQEETRTPEQVERQQQLVIYIRSAVNSFDQVISAAIRPPPQACYCNITKFKHRRNVYNFGDVNHESCRWLKTWVMRCHLVTQKWTSFS